MKKLYLLLIPVCIFISCENKKELDLQKREKALILREEQFAKKEADYKSLLLMRDSIVATKKDTLKNKAEISEWPKSLRGAWDGKLICKESNCNNYVIGDQRTEVWQFLSDSTGIYAYVLDRKKLIRVFKAKYVEDKIMLDFRNDSISKNKLKANVVLDDIQENMIKGTLKITRQDNCAVTFSVELTPPQKN